ncbi:hypothetical protein [Piscirickettsia salmonis]|uniref:hypothetical protein n=1 Tax=Piscirickettsia salmonis TaxID=1238 RepID=UPI0012B94404|nr:hypothetical protein [Piscirickettsia salmonis]
MLKSIYLKVLVRIGACLFAVLLLQACSFNHAEKSQIVNSMVAPFVATGQFIMANAGKNFAQSAA